MSIWQLLKKWRMGSQQKRQFHYILGEPLTIQPLDTATQELTQLNSDSQAVSPPDHTNDPLFSLWNQFTSREQDIIALTCLSFTNRQIGARIGLSEETVKYYVKIILIKLNLKVKADLRVIFASWDFSAWERRKYQR